MKVQVSRQEGVPRIYNRMKVQVKRAGGCFHDLQQDESPGKQAGGRARDYNRMKVQVKRAGGRAQDLQQDKSPGKAGRKACPGSTPG
jgi:hypothetical protein